MKSLKLCKNSNPNNKIQVSRHTFLIDVNFVDGKQSLFNHVKKREIFSQWMIQVNKNPYENSLMRTHLLSFNKKGDVTICPCSLASLGSFF